MKLRMKSNEVRQRHSQVPQKDKERVNCQLLRYNEATQRPQKDFTRLSPRTQKPDTTASPRLDSQVSNLFTSGKNQNKPNQTKQKRTHYIDIYTHIKQIQAITTTETHTIARRGPI